MEIELGWQWGAAAPGGRFTLLFERFAIEVLRASARVTEGLNSKIQSLTSGARGFRGFADYRIRIVFFCGDLDLCPR